MLFFPYLKPTDIRDSEEKEIKIELKGEKR